jgi:uncharacterized protein (TIGR03067 family)
MPRAAASVLLLLAAGSALAAPAPFTRTRPDRTTDQARLQGTWTCQTVSVWRESGWVNVASPSSSDVVIRGDRIVWCADTVEGFTLHTKTSPRGIDFVSPSSGLFLGVYALSADTLSFVIAHHGHARPTLDRGAWKMTYRRKR